MRGLNMLNRNRSAVGALAAGLFLLPTLSAPAIALTGICPDGSVFIARDGTPPPCARAKEVEPSDVPPLRPDYLPQPHTWRVYQELENPNNPYNLIDSVREIQALHEPGDAPLGAAAAGVGAAPRDVASAPPPAAAPVGPLDLGLRDTDLRDLYSLVELSQEVTPAAFERRTANGSGVFRVALARSRAFEQQLADAWDSRGGLGGNHVLVFTAVSKQAEPFHANLTFVQSHLTFQPDADNPRQLGILQGRLGDLEADEVVLGYVILPDSIAVSEPMDVYWNDRRISVAFPQ